MLEWERGESMVQDRELSNREKADAKTLIQFVSIFCKEKHERKKTPFAFRFFDTEVLAEKEILLCSDCAKLLAYGLTMRLKCPVDPKPACRDCRAQCYKGDYKAKIREIMKFSGMYLIRHGRLDMLFHYFK
jgi:hypothetical protein